MAGLAGTALMLAEASRIGVSIMLDAIPAPPATDRTKWLTAFPSYGFLLAVAEPRLAAVLAEFRAAGIAAAMIGNCNDTGRVTLHGADDAPETLWDFSTTDFMKVACHA
jgi:selenophosphate synthetase-related protein